MNKKAFIWIIVSFVLILILGLGIGYFVGNSSTSDNITSLDKQPIDADNSKENDNKNETSTSNVEISKYDLGYMAIRSFIATINENFDEDGYFDILSDENIYNHTTNYKYDFLKNASWFKKEYTLLYTNIIREKDTFKGSNENGEFVIVNKEKYLQKYKTLWNENYNIENENYLTDEYANYQNNQQINQNDYLLMYYFSEDQTTNPYTYYFDDLSYNESTEVYTAKVIVINKGILLDENYPTILNANIKFKFDGELSILEFKTL